MGKPCGFSETDLRCQLHELTDGKLWKHAHHFAEPNNFCFNGKLRILDYGDLRVQEVISECSLKIFNEFDPNYSWEEKKKELQLKEKSI